jgi:hypothetical protein
VFLHFLLLLGFLHFLLLLGFQKLLVALTLSSWFCCCISVCMVPCTKSNGRGLGPAWQACPLEHRPNSAPCAVPMRVTDCLGLVNTPGTSLARNNERYLAFVVIWRCLQPLLKRFSRTPYEMFSWSPSARYTTKFRSHISILVRC